MKILKAIFGNPFAVLNVVLIAVATLLVAIGMIGFSSVFGWCCGLSGEVELVAISTVVVIPLFCGMASFAKNTRLRSDGFVVEHLGQCWIMYIFVCFGVYNYFENMHHILDSGEPGRFFWILLISTALIGIAANIGFLLFKSNDKTYQSKF